MCDYSLEHKNARRAKDEDILVAKHADRTFGTIGFVDAANEDCYVCLKEGDELVLTLPGGQPIEAKFAQVDLDKVWRHHDGYVVDGAFKSFQTLPAGTMAVVKRALPEAITDAVNAHKAFEPEVRVPDVASAPVERVA